MKLTKKHVNQKKFKITDSGTFTIDPIDVVRSKNFQKLLKILKPVSELRKPKM